MTAEEREQDLLRRLVPALSSVWDAVDGPSNEVEHSALVGLNNVIAGWMFKYHPDLLDRAKRS